METYRWPRKSEKMHFVCAPHHIYVLIMCEQDVVVPQLAKSSRPETRFVPAADCNVSVTGTAALSRQINSVQKTHISQHHCRPATCFCVAVLLHVTNSHLAESFQTSDKLLCCCAARDSSRKTENAVLHQYCEMEFDTVTKRHCRENLIFFEPCSTKERVGYRSTHKIFWK